MSVFKFLVVIEKSCDAHFAFCPELQGCFTQGVTDEEVFDNLKAAIRLHIEGRPKRKF